jgi:UDP:flavonoid glycosyltransferase YjiC (YdhE family)
MRIAIASLGSRGDVQPMAALAATLARRGHQVRLITPRGCDALGDEAGVDRRVVDVDVRQELASVEGRRLLHSGRNTVAGLRALRAIGRRHGTRPWFELAEHTEGAELLVCETTSLPPMEAIAERRGLPCIGVAMQPRVPTRAFPHPFAPPPRIRMPGWANRLHHRLIDQTLWQCVRSLVNEGRRDALGLPPWPFFGPYARLRDSSHPWLLPFSRHLFPRPPDWPPQIEVTGYWFFDRPNAWQPSAELLRFLEAGPPPVYIGFGSMVFADPAATAALMLAAVAEAGCRAVLAAGWGGLAPATLPPNVFALEEAPHDWLFPRMAAVVHHGGAGTTAAALRAGVPSVIVPFMGDQFFWAQILGANGVAPEAVPYAGLGVPDLARAMTMALDDPAMRRRAAALGVLIREEDGLGRAAARIEALSPVRYTASWSPSRS